MQQGSQLLLTGSYSDDRLCPRLKGKESSRSEFKLGATSLAFSAVFPHRPPTRHPQTRRNGQRHIFPETLSLAGIFNPPFISSVAALVLHCSNWSVDHTLNFPSVNKDLERPSVAGQVDHTSEYDPSTSPFRSPVLPNVNPTHVFATSRYHREHTRSSATR
jgi:hypothetical protein